MKDSADNNKSLIVGGVSGNKEMRVRRIHKKAAAPAAESEKKEEAAAPKAEAPKAEAPKAEPAVKAEKPAKKATEEKAKAAPKAEPAAKAEKAEKAPAKKTTTKKTEAAPKAEKPAPKAEAPKAEAPKEEAKPKAEAPKAEPKKETKVSPAVVDRTKISSAVVQMPETVRSSTIIPNKGRGGYRDNRGGQGGYNGNRDRNGQGGGFGGNRDRNGQGGGFGGNRDRNQGGFGGNRGGQGGGFPKDKDDDSTPNRPAPRRASKPKTETPLDEMKKSRAAFAERSAMEKRHNDNEAKRDAHGNNQNDKRNRGKDQFNGRINADGDYDDFSYGRKKKKNKSSYQAAPVVEQVITDVQIPAFITVKDFAEGIGKKSGDVIKELMKLGIMATLNQELDFDTACLVADAFGINATLLEEKTEEDILIDEGEDNPEGLVARPPVVVVMGHVDHGKTSLLDRIRSASVVAGEAGGITQHIGAYTVRTKGRQITFLDTPGHEAFTTMRARGANFTDIAILVVAADDGVMPQTIESINHAKAAGTEIVVAINKIDKPGANPEKVKQELTQYELIPEEWGGSTIMCPVSAKKGDGIDDLLENVLLVADVKELKADPTRQAKGAVIEAKLDKNRGPVATVLVQRGTLKQGDTVVCGAMIGNVRAMTDDKGKDIKKAGPSTPVEILGLPEVPEAGDMLYAVTDDKMARQLVEKRKIKEREEKIRKSSKMSLESLAAQLAQGDVKDLNLIIKADVQGSVEAVTQSLERLTNDEVRVKVVHGGVGAINESDITLADVSNAIVIGFNVRPNAMIIEKAKEAGVDIRLYSVIYNAIEDVEKAMKGMLAPTFEEVVLGHVEIRELFKVSGVGTIGGAYVLDGKVKRDCGVRVVRDDVVVYTGKLGSLQRMKDAVKEVNAGYECGLSVENFNDIKLGDIIESFENREVERDA
ncbi:MAG: translation initiation factor IF-2 [Saccharofermentans sp.]|nr:translation initiation factor IF-2 [Saccharofermentans sp.]